MRLSFSTFLLLLLTLVSANVKPVAAGESDKPNIVFFLVDDLGWSDVGCYGSSFYDTPNIDALAGEGVRFTDAYATCHVCSPSRASIMTGQYPARLKLTDWLGGREDHPFQRLKNAFIHQALPLDELTLAEVLKRHGYRTGHFGKWHLGEKPAGPLHQGFDIQVPRNWYKGWPRAGYHAPFKLDGLASREGDYLTDRLTDEALKFIDKHSRQPFFLYLSHFAVHDPIQGRADLVEKYEKKRSQLPPADRPYILEGNPDAKTAYTRGQLDQMIQEDAYAPYRVLPNQMVKIKQRQDNPQFAAMVESVDESLGRILAKLKALGLVEDTIIIFTSDNGGMSAANFGNPDHVIPSADLDEYYSTSNLPLRGAKGWLYEGGIRVPLIIKWPGKGKVGSICRESVTGVDYYPTILDMVGIPTLPQQRIDGESLVPLFQGQSTLDRDALYWHFPHYSNHGMQSPGGAIRCGKYKLLEYFENGSIQLFDLEADLEEQYDLSQRHPEIAGQLLKKLHQWQKALDAEMMGPNPGFDENATAGYRYRPPEAYISTWQISGPYTQAGVERRALFDLAFGPETDRSGDWKPITLKARDREVDLSERIGGEHRVAYLRTRIFCPTTRRAVLELGSDDGVKVWLNRSLIHQNNEEREVTPGEDKVDMALKQGWNHLLVKVTQGVGGWGFIACVTDENGEVFDDLKIRETTVAEPARLKPPPNILFALADDWSWPHASIAHDMGIAGSDSVVKTPVFDRIARQGVLFKNAFCSAPSCSPSRSAILTGRNMWELETAANLRGIFPNKFGVYPDALEQAGYHVGYMDKGCAPVKLMDRKRNPAGPRYENFSEFIEKRPDGKPFCFWFGSWEAHRSYEYESGVRSGMNPKDVAIPACLPDDELVAKDMCDYYLEVQRFDRKLGKMLDRLKDQGELENTLVVIAGDNGLPFPRCKVEIYDTGTHVPLAISWPAAIKGGRVVDDFVNLAQLGPTFMAAVGLEPLKTMTTKSFMNVLMSDRQGQVDPKRDKAFTGRGYHDYRCRADDTGYPARALRTADFLYIRNYEPDRWPSGDPVEFRKRRGPYGEVDPSPTKTYMVEHRDNPKVRKLFKLAFEKRPYEELYDLRTDPWQLNNVAERPEYTKAKRNLVAVFEGEFTATYDPSALGIPPRPASIGND